MTVLGPDALQESIENGRRPEEELLLIIRQAGVNFHSLVFRAKALQVDAFRKEALATQKIAALYPGSRS